MNARISLLPNDKCYLLSECLVNLIRVWHSLFLYQTFWQKILDALYSFVLLGFSLYVSCIHCPTLKYYKRCMGKLIINPFNEWQHSFIYIKQLVEPTSQVILFSNYKQNALFIATKRNTHTENRSNKPNIATGKHFSVEKCPLENKLCFVFPQ